MGAHEPGLFGEGTRMEDVLISAVIVNCNGRALLSDCLEALFEQSFNSIEILVVDNASNDGSVAMVRERFPQVRLICLDSNRGFPVSVNAGVEASRGDFIVVLNEDTRVEPEFMAELHKAMLENSAASTAAPKMLFAHGSDIVNSAGLGYSIAGTNHDIGFGVKDGAQFAERKWVFGSCGGAVMYRRGVFEDVGLLDEDFFMYCDDVDFSFRAQLAGHRCIFVPTARVYHYEGVGGGSMPKSRGYYLARNSLEVIVKNFPRRLLLKYWHVVLWEMAKRAGSPLLKGDFSALWGYVAGLFRLRKALRKRAGIQARKRVADTYIEEMLVRNRSVVREINLYGKPQGKPIEKPQ